MKNNKKFLILLIVVVIAIIAGGYWYYNYNKEQPIQTEVAGMEIIKRGEFSDLPKTIEQACQEATDMSGEPIDPSDERLCNIFRSSTQSELLAFIKKLQDTKIGDTIEMPFSTSGGSGSTGTVIDLNGQRAILALVSGRQSVGTHAELYWFDRDLTLFFIGKDLTREDRNHTVAEARESKEYKEFLEVISTFKPNR